VKERSVRKGLVAVGAAAVLVLGAASAVLLSNQDSGGRAAPTPSPTAAPSRTPLLLPAPGDGPQPTTEGLTRALAGLLGAPALGGGPSVSVVDVLSGAALLSAGPARAATPASTAKLLTAVAALTTLEPSARLTTRVVQGAPGEVVLVGGGDPTLAGAYAGVGAPAPARLADLAAGLRGQVVRRVLVDDSLFTGPRLGPGWKPGYVTHGDVAPVSALAVDEGRASDRDGAPRVADPALAAGRQLAALLHVRAPVVRGAAPAGATVLAQVQSPTVADLVERMLTRSDNDLAEALGRQVALARGLPATFAGEAQALAAAVGVPGLALQDASGLSRLDAVPAAALTTVLVRATSEPRLAAVLSGLPVAGFDGTLADRYRKAPTLTAAGQVRAKTGTLDGVSALAGLVRTQDGRLLAFALLADRVPLGGTVAAEAALDRVAAALAACGCR
jgi:D-alanyl-D-alanine carboxypeptidase/D-alanyl-D-alanine-endopeptidase (penicillin-binding protein 4)